MSFYGRGERNPCSMDDESRSRLSSSSWLFQQPCFPDFRDTLLLQNPNPIPSNQTLEDAFARLSVVPNNHSLFDFNHSLFDFVGEGSTLIGGYPPNYHSNVGQMQRLARYNAASASQNCCARCDRDNGVLNNPSRSQEHYGAGSYNAFMNQRLPSSNDNNELCFGFQGKSRGRVMSNNEVLLSTNNNRLSVVPGLNVNNGWRHRSLQQPSVHGSVYELKGKVLSFAKDQLGCRVLQDTMKSLKSQEEVSFVFLEMIDNVIELMLDPSGNYVFQKLVEICNEEQRTRIISVLTKSHFQLATICLDIHGTRAVQKLLEHVTTQEQRNLIMPALCPGAVALTKDLNGLHVLEHCLKHFPHEDNKCLLNIVANNCFDIATDKSGCCVMQHCVDHAQGETKEQLMDEIIANASLLAEDCYGNYVVQHLVSLKIPRVIERLLRQLENKFFTLSCNKYGSNVVEKFFQDSGEEYSTQIILELLCNQNVPMLLVDPYGNYVIKSAISMFKGSIRNTLHELVELHSPMMRGNLYGKKLLAWFDRWKRRQK